MAIIIQFPERKPKAQQLPQTNLAVVALVNGAVLAATVDEHLDDLTDAQLTQAVEQVAGLTERLMDLVEKRSIRAQQ